MTKVVNINKEPCDICIMRPSKWGNLYSHKDGTLAKYKVATRQIAISKYRDHILNSPELLLSIHELEGKKLGCTCHPLPCHGDILVELLNQKQSLESILR